MKKIPTTKSFRGPESTSSLRPNDPELTEAQQGTINILTNAQLKIHNSSVGFLYCKWCSIFYSNAFTTCPCILIISLIHVVYVGI